MTPGPSPVPARVREALSREIIHHRTDEFRQIIKEVNEGLKYIFCTSNPVITFASSGTGAMEAAVSNFFSFKDKVVVISGGKFGQRWKEIGVNFGLEVIEIKIPWGSSPSLQQIEEIIREHKDIKGLFTTLCETSTGTVYDIKSLKEIIARRDILFVVDAISGLGQDELLTDEWGIDVVVSGSQKGFMLPPGLAFISISQKAQSFLKESNLPKYYFSLEKYLKSYEKNDTPYTPSVSLIVALREAISLIKEEGIQKRWQRFKKLSLATQEAALKLGLKIFSQRPSSSITAINSPEGIPSTSIVKKLRKEYGVSIAAGQDAYKDKIFRIAHMGWINEQDLIMCFSLLEKVLKELKFRFKEGASLVKLQEVLISYD